MPRRIKLIMINKTKCPYSFPLKSRKAMTEYILARKGYSDGGTKFPFSWNVKAHGVNYERPEGEYTPLEKFDELWKKKLQDTLISTWAFEDTQSDYVNEYSTYPGADQGEWTFGFYGRSSGHLCLEKWQEQKFYGRGFGDVEEWLLNLSFMRIRQFYKALVCMDKDFTQKNASINVAAALNNIRKDFEEELLALQEETEKSFAEEYENSRPDLYAEQVA
jgi:hypothetical protein